MSASFEIYIQQYRSDLESVYQTWFINNEERLKAFRTIKNGINQVVEEVERNQFGNDFKGSSLEVVTLSKNRFSKGSGRILN